MNTRFHDIVQVCAMNPYVPWDLNPSLLLNGPEQRCVTKHAGTHKIGNTFPIAPDQRLDSAATKCSFSSAQATTFSRGGWNELLRLTHGSFNRIVSLLSTPQNIQIEDNDICSNLQPYRYETIKLPRCRKS